MANGIAASDAAADMAASNVTALNGARFSWKENLSRLVLVTALLVPLAGCIGYEGTVQRGYLADPGTLQKLKNGESAENVLSLLGTPSTTSTVGGDAWYYISQTTIRRLAFMNREITDQRILAVYFNKANRVERIANYGMEDGKLFDYISRTTPTAGGDATFVQNMIKNLLKFN